MVLKGVELLMSRRQIDQIIKRDPVMVVFRRRPKIATSANGWKWGPETLLDPQEVCLIPFKRRMVEFLINTELGSVPDLPYVLLGRHNLDMEKDDLFTFNGDEFKVETLDISEPEVKTAAHIDYFGGGVNA